MLKHFIIIPLMVVLITYQALAQKASGYLSPDKLLTQYHISVFNKDNGFPINSLGNLFQSLDGYLWISNFNTGLIRFDGASYKLFSSKNIEVFKTNTTSDIVETPDGTMWIGTYGNGLLAYKNGKFVQKGNSNFVQSLSVDAANQRLWIGTRNQGVYYYDYQNFHLVENQDALNNTIINDILAESENTWFATENKGLVLFHAKKYTVFNKNNGLPSNQVGALLKTTTKGLWVSTSAGICSYNGETFQPIKGLEKVYALQMKEDKTGSIWMATQKGLVRVNGKTGQIERLTDKNGLPHNDLYDVLIDRESNVWIATYRQGLVRLQDNQFINYSSVHGLAGVSNSVTEDAQGNFLVATEGGFINRIQKGVVDTLQLTTKIPKTRIRHLLVDSKKNLWVSTYEGLLLKTADGKEKLFKQAEGLPDNQVRLTYEDSKGNIWVGMKTGLVKIIKGEYEQQASWKSYKVGENGLSSNFIMSIKEDSKGNILIGTNTSGWNRIQPNDRIEVFNTKTGFPGDLVFSIRPDKDGDIWIATSTGLVRMHQDKFFNFTVQSGLEVDAVFDLLEDKHGNFWMSTSLGILVVAKSDLLAYQKGDKKAVKYKLYTKKEGMGDSECVGATQIYQSSDGGFWFNTLGGVSYVNPEKYRKNEIIPPIAISELLIDGQTVDTYQKDISIEPQAQRFIFKFSVLSFSSPANVRFKYKLENYDDDWQEGAGLEKEAVYTGIPYGNYTFRVIACNNDGVWNEQGIAISFYKKPYFYQNWWFYLLASAVLASIFYGIYRWRVYSIHQRNKELEALVEKRTHEIQKANEELSIHQEEILMQNQELAQQQDEILAQRDHIEAKNIELERQKKEVEDSYNNIEIISKIGKEITATLEIDKILDKVYDYVNSIMDATEFGVGVYDEKQQLLDYALYMEKGERLPTLTVSVEEERFSTWVIKNKKPIIIKDVTTQYQHYLTKLAEPMGELKQSMMILPLLLEDKVVGIVSVKTMEKNAYNESHEHMLQTLATYITIALENAQIYQTLKSTNNRITAGLRYAEEIQRAILPTENSLKEAFAEHFVIFKPHSIVSGDFYWYDTANDMTYLAVVDCTGHGVPGAFMSMIGNALLYELVHKEKETDPAKILYLLHQGIYTRLRQAQTDNRDGMDVCLCVMRPINDHQFEIQFAGAGRPLFYTHNNILGEIKSFRRSLGGKQNFVPEDFTTHTIILEKGDSVFLSSDGFADNPIQNRKKFGVPTLKSLLEKHQAESMKRQKEILVYELESKQGFHDQRDDITLLGIRL